MSGSGIWVWVMGFGVSRYGVSVSRFRGSWFSRFGVFEVRGYGPGLGFEVSRSRVSGSGFRVRGFAVRGFEFRGFGYGVSRTGFRCSGFGILRFTVFEV